MNTNELDQLFNRAKINAELRANSSIEVREVAEYSNKLFDAELPPELCKEFRLLCACAVREPKPPVIRSHRPLFGPIIVFIKKLSWRILRVLLKDTIESQQMFNRKTVRLLARSVIKN